MSIRETRAEAFGAAQDYQFYLNRFDAAISRYVEELEKDNERLRGEVSKFRTEVKRVSKAQRLTKLELKELKARYDELIEISKARESGFEAAYQQGFVNGLSERGLAEELANDAINDPPF